MERNRKILSDINNPRCFDKIKVKQFDNVTIEYNLFENGKELDITGSVIQVMVLKSDYTIVIQESKCIISGNKLCVELDRESTKVDGIAKVEIKITKDKKQITTFETVMNIEKSIFKDEYGRKNLIEVLIELQDGLDEAKQLVLALDSRNTTATSNISELDSRNTLASENISKLDSRNTTATSNISELDSRNTLASEIKNDLNNWIIENEDIKDIDGRVYNNSSQIKEIKEGIVNSTTIVISEDSPIGTIIWFSGKQTSSIDGNVWRVCNGTKLNKNEYLDLWNVIGSNENYGNNGEDVFKLPDLVSLGKSIKSVDLDYNTGSSNSKSSSLTTVKTNLSIAKDTAMIPCIKISDMSMKGTEISQKIGQIDDKVENNKNEINNMKDAIIQNRPIVITDDVPIGTIIWWASDKISQLDIGIWKIANGQTLKKIEYTELYELFKDNSNYTVSSTEFNLPNLIQNRRFIRSVGDDYNVGFTEDCGIKAHNHLLVNNDGKRINLTPDFDSGVESGSIDSYHYSRASANKSNNVNSWQASSFTSSTGESETRPKNIGLLPIIKCKAISKDMQSIAQEWTGFKEGNGNIEDRITVESSVEKKVKTIYESTGKRVYRPSYNNRIVDENGNDISNIIQTPTAFTPSQESKNSIELGMSSCPFSDLWIGLPAINENGFSKLPNGLIMQWGNVWIPPQIVEGLYSAIVYFPLAFPNNALSVQVTRKIDAIHVLNQVTNYAVAEMNETHFSLDMNHSSEALGSGVILKYLAIGH